MNLRDVNAVVLCGGLGTRLRPVIGESQKVMANFDGAPFLDIIIGFLNQQGIQKIILSAGYKAELIERHCSQHPSLVIEKIISEPEPLGTWGAVKYAPAKALLKSENFFVLNGDSFCNVNLSSLLSFHLGHKASATITASFAEAAGDYGSVVFNQTTHLVEGFQEKKKGALKRYVNAGVYCFNQRIFSITSPGSSLEKNVFPMLANQKSLYAFPVKEIFYDIGTPERLKKASAILRKIKK